VLLQPAQHLAEDNRGVAAYLAGVTGEAIDLPDEADASIDAMADSSSTMLMAQAQQIMEQAHQEGREPDEALRQLVERAFTETADAGRRVGDEEEHHEPNGVNGVSRRRID
jgi:hypothetical protein